MFEFRGGAKPALGKGDDAQIVFHGHLTTKALAYFFRQRHGQPVGNHAGAHGHAAIPIHQPWGRHANRQQGSTGCLQGRRDGLLQRLQDLGTASQGCDALLLRGLKVSGKIQKRGLNPLCVELQTQKAACLRRQGQSALWSTRSEALGSTSLDDQAGLHERGDLQTESRGRGANGFG